MGQALETFMVRRSPRSEFAASVYVFPGGSVRQDDMSDEAQAACGCTLEEAHALFLGRGSELPPSPRTSLGLVVAALRELFEEAGVLLATEREGGPMVLDRPGRRERLALARHEVEEGRLPLAQLVLGEGLRLAWRELAYFSHWVTPRAFPIRFDTRFFVAPLPEGQAALHGPRETTDGRWISPRAALDASERGEFPLVFATSNHLLRLSGPETVDDLLRFAREKPIRTLEPPTRETKHGPEPYLASGEPDW
jgi:8-oxo-dGTP pyrophosphatase MutT (NUDIX family)